MTNFYWEYWKVGRELLRAVAVGLDLQDEDYLAKKHSGHDNQLRLLHYLPVPAADLENNRVGWCSAHTDWSSMTMLLQDECGGLEVEDVTKPGTFVAAEPVKHAIVLNVGDLLQRWSNGTFWLSSLRQRRGRRHTDSDRPAPIYKPPREHAASCGSD
jgi:isopenicillin N synthase-like dioxygenase